MGDLACRFSDVEDPAGSRGNSGGVVSAVLQAAQTGQEERHRVPATDVTDDPTHRVCRLCCFHEGAIDVHCDAAPQKLYGNDDEPLLGVPSHEDSLHVAERSINDAHSLPFTKKGIR
jgi:hypothetical protein